MKISMFGALMLGGCLTVVSQAGIAATQDAAASDTPHATVEGCLNAVAEGRYELTRQGKHYQLSGDTAKLKPLVGKEVRIYGALMAADAGLPGSMASASQEAGATEQIRVSTVNQLDDVCWHKSDMRP